MAHQGKHRSAPWIVLVLLLPWCITPGELFGGKGDNTPQETSERPAPFVLTVLDGLLSLRAQGASLKAIVEELGQRLDIEVVARISQEEHVTMAFDQLSLEEALKRFRPYARIVYLIQESAKAQDQITKILVLPKPAGIARAGPTSQAADRDERERAGTSDRKGSDAGLGAESQRAKPFQFKFDPAKMMEQRP